MAFPAPLGHSTLGPRWCLHPSSIFPLSLGLDFTCVWYLVDVPAMMNQWGSLGMLNRTLGVREKPGSSLKAKPISGRDFSLDILCSISVNEWSVELSPTFQEFCWHIGRLLHCDAVNTMAVEAQRTNGLEYNTDLQKQGLLPRDRDHCFLYRTWVFCL